MRNGSYPAKAFWKSKFVLAEGFNNVVVKHHAVKPNLYTDIISLLVIPIPAFLSRPIPVFLKFYLATPSGQ